MKYIFILVAVLFISCGDSSNTPKKTDSVVIHDSVPQQVMVGKGGDWGYKPDTAMNILVLGSGETLREWTRDNGNQSIDNGELHEMPFVNSSEKELLSVFTISENGKQVPFGFRVKKFSKSQSKKMAVLNYSTDRNFISGHGIYIGMPMDYVQSIYTSQPMMKWIKNDTTYLAYAPAEKDKEHFKRYTHVNYSALYKFVNGQLCWMEMMVDHEAFENK